jgi:hypothetical protein
MLGESRRMVNLSLTTFVVNDSLWSESKPCESLGETDAADETGVARIGAQTVKPLDTTSRDTKSNSPLPRWNSASVLQWSG